jgi:plastocyanin
MIRRLFPLQLRAASVARAWNGSRAEAPRRHTAAMLLASAVCVLIPASARAQTSVPGVAHTRTTRTVTVTIKNLAFVPKVIHVRAGTAVVWTNRDDVEHTVTSGTTADDGTWKSSSLLPFGTSFTVRFAKRGTFPYFCKPHFYDPSMHGTVVVDS